MLQIPYTVKVENTSSDQMTAVNVLLMQVGDDKPPNVLSSAGVGLDFVISMHIGCT